MLSSNQIIALARAHGTPLWIYDAALIRRRIDALRRFDVIRYAQKANANVHILKLMRAEGVAVDAVSEGEIVRSLAAGYQPGQTDELVFTADVIDHRTMRMVAGHRITVNAGSLDMLERIGSHAPGHRIWLRINPGFGHGHSNKTNTGGPHSKHGIWFDQVPQALALVRRYRLDLQGLHMHIGSGADYAHLARVCDALVQVARRLDHDIGAISAGGGLPLPADGQEPGSDIEHYFQQWNAARNEIAGVFGHPIRLEIEPGRFLLGQCGVLVSEVHAIKTTPRHRFALVDAGFNDLLRPALYGSHHRISVLAQDGSDAAARTPARIVVAGPLCEAGDVFTQRADGEIVSRSLPEPMLGDLMVFHDAGAYGAAMSSNYNSRPLAPELLVDGAQTRVIRRRQSMRELLELEGMDASATPSAAASRTTS